MACADKKDWRADIVEIYEANRPKLPKWLKVFMSGTPRKMDCGASKAVYVFGDKAISVEKAGPQDVNRQAVIRKRLKKIPKKYRKHFNYYKNEFLWYDYVFRELSLCPEGTLRDMFNKTLWDMFNEILRDMSNKTLKGISNKTLMDMFGEKYNITDQMIKDLITALCECHKAGLAIVDLKPDNIMLCKCDCLAFIDLDSAVPMPYREGVIYATDWWNIIRYTRRRDKKMLKGSDWIAMSLVVMMHYAARYFTEDREKHKDLIYYVSRDFVSKDRTYDRIRILLSSTDFPTELGKAAYELLRQYDYKKMKLPDKEYIDRLITVSGGDPNPKRKWWLKF